MIKARNEYAPRKNSNVVNDMIPQKRSAEKGVDRITNSSVANNNALKRTGSNVEDILSIKRSVVPRVSNQQTCLEQFGMQARNENLFRNEWQRTAPYTKMLVDAEYAIQTEFKVSTYEDRLKEEMELSEQKEKEREARNAEKQAAKKVKREAREAKKNTKAASVQGGLEKDRNPEPKETTTTAQNLSEEAIAEALAMQNKLNNHDWYN